MSQDLKVVPLARLSQFIYNPANYVRNTGGMNNSAWDLEHLATFKMSKMKGISCINNRNNKEVHTSWQLLWQSKTHPNFSLKHIKSLRTCDFVMWLSVYRFIHYQLMIESKLFSEFPYLANFVMAAWIKQNNIHLTKHCIKYAFHLKH